jgi:eukaryotic-like serine/threonine-protein kinase
MLVVMGARGPQPGDVVDGRYRLEILVGTGGMGAVWSARLPGAREAVAVKFLHSQMAAEPLLVQRFLLEARAGGMIVHPNVIRVLRSGRLEAAGAEAVPYLVMELLSGKTLTDVLRDHSTLAIVDALSLVADIARGAAAAHAAGIVHRDLKPANVFLHVERGREVVPKILDFGISKFTDPGLDGGLTTTGMVIGSTSYMSPEQAVGSRDVDARSDIWSLGVLLYRLITGESPLPSGAQAAVVALGGPKELTLAALDAPAIPAPVRAIVRQCLRKKRDERYESASALEAALREVIARDLGGVPASLTPLVVAASSGRIAHATTSSATVASAPPASLDDAVTARDAAMAPTAPGRDDEARDPGVLHDATVLLPPSVPKPLQQAPAPREWVASGPPTHRAPLSRHTVPIVAIAVGGIALVASGAVGGSLLVRSQGASRDAEGHNRPSPASTSAPEPATTDARPLEPSAAVSSASVTPPSAPLEGQPSAAEPAPVSTTTPRAPARPSKPRLGAARAAEAPKPTAAPAPSSPSEPWRRPGF